MADTNTAAGTGTEPVRVNTDELASIYQLVVEQQQIIEKELGKLKELYEGLDSVWAGEDYDTFRQQYDQDLPFFDGAFVTLNDVALELRDDVKDYQRLESWISESFAAVRELQQA